MWEYRARVKSVIDADTLSLAVDLGFDIWHDIRLRVEGLDCPERNTPDGRAASLFAITLLGVPAYVTVRTRFDRSFARYVGAVDLPDGTSYATRLIDAGHGRPHQE